MSEAQSLSIAQGVPLLKGCQIVGVFLGAQHGRNPEWGEAMRREIDHLCAEGKLRPGIGGSYPLQRAPEALRDLLDRRAVGRLVVTP